jgi:hypothetical protein
MKNPVQKFNLQINLQKKEMFHRNNYAILLNMKKILPIIFVLAVTVSTQAQPLKDNNGWWFLEWKMSKNKVEELLIENKKNLSQGTALDADFMFQGLNTWLIYNKSNQLIQVDQRMTFSVNEADECKAFYEKVKADLVRDYGKPNHEKRNIIDSVITLKWDLAYTLIQLEYDYKYKIIDEFGAGSYWVKVTFQPAITSKK